MKLSDADKLGLSPAEIATLEADTGAEGASTTTDDAAAQAAAAEAAAGEAAKAAADAEAAAKVEADAKAAKEAADAQAAADAAAATEAAKGKDGGAEEGGDKALTADQLAEVLEDDTRPARAPALPTYKAGEAKDYAAERKTLRSEIAAIEAKWSAGDLTDEEKSTQQGAVQDKLDALLVEQTRSQTLKDINEQNARETAARRANEMTSACEAVLKAAKASGTIDYLADQAAAKQFDVALGMLEADADNAHLTARELAARAHQHVLVMRGKATPSPAPSPTAGTPAAATPAASAPAAATPAAPAAPAKPRDVPQTLGGLPNAGQQVLGDETYEQFNRLSGEDAEIFLAKQSPAVVARLMAQADAAARTH